MLQRGTEVHSRLRVICVFAVGRQSEKCLHHRHNQISAETRSSQNGGLTHGAFPHQADELMRPRLPRHPQQDFSDRVTGEPVVLLR